MRFNAYILAADPSWIKACVPQYYPYINRLIVAYDQDGISWSKTSFEENIEKSMQALKEVDVDKKMVFVGGDYHSLDNPHHNEYRQRNDAMAEASKDADWVLQIDTDEYVPDVPCLLDRVSKAAEDAYEVCWPMRSIFNRTANGKYLMVCDKWMRPAIEYPGSIAVRAGTALDFCRGTGKKQDIVQAHIPPTKQLRKPANKIKLSQSIIHLSWARDDAMLQQKLSGSAHSKDFDIEAYYQLWKDSPQKWFSMRNFHPLTPTTWARLRPVSLPISPSLL